MSENDKKEKKVEDERTSNSAEHLKLYKTEAQENSKNSLEALSNVKKISNKNSPWTLTQELLQEIIATYTISNPDKLPALTIMVDDLKKQIAIKYAEDLVTQDILLKSIPTMRTVREWVKRDGWEEAVWGYIKADGLFSPNKRAQVIESLRSRAIDKSDAAAKIWLTLSGDYSEKMEVDNKSVDIYREINNILHGKKKSEA